MLSALALRWSTSRGPFGAPCETPFETHPKTATKRARRPAPVPVSGVRRDSAADGKGPRAAHKCKNVSAPWATRCPGATGDETRCQDVWV
jgi:hypothetical protein